VGSEAFLESVQSHLERKRELREHPRRERYAGRPSLQALLGPKGLKRDRAARDEAIRKAYRHGYTLSEIGDCLGLHYSTISRIARAGQS
jgi:DNA-binding NarL/FixJ family response regulator